MRGGGREGVEEGVDGGVEVAEPDGERVAGGGHAVLAHGDEQVDDGVGREAECEGGHD